MKDVFLRIISGPTFTPVSNDPNPFELQGAAAADSKQPFLATVTYAGIASDGPVGGTEEIEGGPYKIFIPVALMEKRVDELKGKGVFAADTLDTHQGAEKVGTFSNAYMQRFIGTEIHAVNGGGFFDMASKNDKLMAKIVERARNGELGFSYDLKDAPGHLDSTIISGETVVVLDDFKWRGATILRREAAAYMWTRLAANRTGAPASSAQPVIVPSQNPGSPARAASLAPGAASPQPPTPKPIEDFEMDEAKMKELLAAAMAPLNATLGTLGTTVAGFESRLVKIEAAQAAHAPAAPVVPAAAPAAGAKMTVADLTAAFTAAAKESNKALLAELGLTAAAPGTGARMTLTASQLDIVTRYGGDEAKDDPTSPEAIEAAITTVQAAAGKTIRNQAAGDMIGKLRAAKRALRLQGGQGATN